jgi:hypothetical protein
MHYLKSLAPLLGLVLVLGCTSQAYPGPARPESEVSKVTFSTSGQVSMYGAELDGQALAVFSDSVQVLPGSHSFTLRYEVDSDQECRSDDLCFVTTAYGVCLGTLRTQAGRSYLVTVKNQGTWVHGTVLAKSYFDFSVRNDEPNVGSITCEASGERYKAERNHVRKKSL